MELVLFDAEGVYVGSVFSKNNQPPPQVVLYASGDVHEAYLATAPAGVRAGGIPRYVRTSLLVTTTLQDSDPLQTVSREREGRRGRRR